MINSLMENMNKENKENLKNPLLEGPELSSPEEEIDREGELSFSFASDVRRYYLGHQDGRPFFQIEYRGALPESLSEEEKHQFSREIRKSGDTEEIIFALKYGDIPDHKEETEKPLSRSEKYLVAEARDFEKGMIDRFVSDEKNKGAMADILSDYSDMKPEEISEITERAFEATRLHDREAIRAISGRFPKEALEKISAAARDLALPKVPEIETAQFAEILKAKKVLFYTGAGISMASGVHNMDQLEKSLGIDMSKEADDLLKKAVKNPQEVIDSWEKFTKDAFEKPATEAHEALARLAVESESKIFTENIDRLQEKAGVKAIHLTGPWLKENVRPEWLKDIDAIVTVGLSFDDRGLLGWYKENNPAGRIVAINMNQPSYLGKEDFLIKGDCQQLIPELERKYSAASAS